MRHPTPALPALTILLALAFCGPALSAPAPPASPVAADKIRLLLDLADDPEVRAALDSRRAGGPQPAPDNAGMNDTMAGGLGTGLQRLREHIGELAQAVPRLPEEADHARALLGDMLDRGDAWSLALFAPLFIALGFGGEALFRLRMRRFGRWLMALPLETVKERVSAVFVRLSYGLGIVASFALGSVGAMLPFDWTPRIKQVLLALLLTALITRLAAVTGRFLLAPGAPRFRVVPLGTPAAAFLFRRLVVGGFLLGVGTQVVLLLGPFGFDAPSRELVVDAVSTLALALALEAVLRFPRAPAAAALPEEPPPPPLPHAEWRRLWAGWARLALSAALVLLWCFAVADADKPFWLLLFAVGGPCAVAVIQRSVRHVMRPAGGIDPGEVRRIEAVLVERGIRTLTIVGAAALLAHLLGLDVATLAMHDTASDRITRGVIGVVVVVLIADFLWHVIAALIDRKLAATASDAGDGGAHAARLQTLLPIARNLSLAALVVVAGTMVMASLGVEIGPLIASAGVVGVAIGFGAQTLVKDIISGIFYLVDDAFRVGEYIQSGNYKGTVESFSLRSVKLRHQRGALYTIPFGTLGAVQNLSRDWVVDKIVLNVPYDTDLELVRRIMKRIGAELREDAELGPGIIGPLKLQGVQQFGDYAIKLQTKMTTLPGDVQFAARRRALLLIQRDFRAHGIGFALPTVQVSGDAPEAAAAHGALSLLKAPEPAAAE